MKIYTKTGDKGQTSLYDGTRVDKDNIRVESYGTLDELNSYIGLCTNYANDEDKKILRDIQIKLFSISAELATKEEGKYKNWESVLPMVNSELYDDEAQYKGECAYRKPCKKHRTSPSQDQ